MGSKEKKTPRKTFSVVNALAHAYELAFESSKQGKNDLLVDQS